MRTLGYFALGLSVLMMLACNGGGTSNGNQNSNVPISPYGNGMYNNMSTDIVQMKGVDRIVGRPFHVLTGRGQQNITSDPCAEANDTASTDPIQIQIGNTQPMGRRNQNDIEFRFDPNGILTVIVTNLSGQMTSQAIQPVALPGGNLPDNTYALNAAGQSLVIGSFDTFGTPSPQFIRMVLQQHGLVNTRRQYDPYDDSTYVDPGVLLPTRPNGGGFVSGFQPGQNPQTPVINPAVANQAVQNKSVSHISSKYGATEIPIYTASLNMNRQHIDKMGSATLTEDNEVFVFDPSTNTQGCQIISNSVINGVVLQ